MGLKRKEKLFSSLENREEKEKLFLRFLKIERRTRHEKQLLASERKKSESFLFENFSRSRLLSMSAIGLLQMHHQPLPPVHPCQKLEGGKSRRKTTTAGVAFLPRSHSDCISCISCISCSCISCISCCFGFAPCCFNLCFSTAFSCFWYLNQVAAALALSTTATLSFFKTVGVSTVAIPLLLELFLLFLL